MGGKDLFSRTYWNWKGRIGRAHFLFGLIAMMFGWQLASGAALYLLFFSTSLFRLVAILLVVAIPFLVFLTSLVAQRTHDLGWSAAGPLGVFVVAIVAQATVYVRFFVEGGDMTVDPFLFVAFAASMVWVVLVLFLAFAPGQQNDNRFGPPPKPVA